MVLVCSEETTVPAKKGKWSARMLLCWIKEENKKTAIRKSIYNQRIQYHKFFLRKKKERKTTATHHQNSFVLEFGDLATLGTVECGCGLHACRTKKLPAKNTWNKASKSCQKTKEHRNFICDAVDDIGWVTESTYFKNPHSPTAIHSLSPHTLQLQIIERNSLDSLCGACVIDATDKTRTVYTKKKKKHIHSNANKI